MYVELVDTSRRPQFPVWLAGVLLLWASIQAAVLYLSAKTGWSIVTCPLKALTAVPCPGCGTTRGAGALAAGHVLDAFQCNPLVFAAGAVALALLLLRVVFGRTLRLQVAKSERPLLWALAAAAVAANWAYVVLHVG